jgi:hypothetical protein
VTLRPILKINTLNAGAGEEISNEPKQWPKSWSLETTHWQKEIHSVLPSHYYICSCGNFHVLPVADFGEKSHQFVISLAKIWQT